MRASLFDQLYSNIDIESATPAQRNPEVSQAATAAPKNITGMKFTHSLIKHLDMLYSKMLAGEVAEIATEPKNNPKQKVIVGQTNDLILEEKEAYFNPGHSAVTESM